MIEKTQPILLEIPMSDFRRELLADYVDKRITIAGMYDKLDSFDTGVRRWKTALLQDVFAEVEGKEIDLGHLWVQHAEPLRDANLKYGDRVKMNCRVGKYQKRLRTPDGKTGLMMVTAYNVSWPTEVEILCRVNKEEQVPSKSFTPVLTENGTLEKTDIKFVPPKPSSDDVVSELPTAVSLILEVKKLAERAGGWDALQQIIDALRG
jgi:hypothetical protein